MSNPNLPANLTDPSGRAASLAPYRRQALSRRLDRLVAADASDELAVWAEGRARRRRLESEASNTDEAAMLAIEFLERNSARVGESATGQYLVATFLEALVTSELDILNMDLP